MPELIEEYSQSLEDIMASQVPGGESGKQSEIENQVRNLIAVSEICSICDMMPVQLQEM